MTTDPTQIYPQDVFCSCCKKASNPRDLEYNEGICDACAYCAREKQSRIDGSDAFRAATRAKFPARFQDTDVFHPKFNSKAWAAIKDWRPDSKNPWLGLVSPAGKCKSRMAHQLGENLAVEMALSRAKVIVEFVSAQEIKEITMQQFFKSREVACGEEDTTPDDARHRLWVLRRCEILVIDDLGKARLTPAVAEELFAIIDQRYAHNRTTIWTSNSTAVEIAGALPDDMAESFAGRLVECSTTYTLS